ncbi:nickel-dependent hydrogenase large subunit [Candidatus Acidianus copahuensis]|uniref:nickel-dependent hydrogenase large subunit n=1 Tax=Candidatus Acidianus copahuensis TaxID=1160895 RepID=UPI0006948AD3|nr:nickel-dependent hydrogenase large subunit [Candidatus Acidianus copahuensis]
MLDPLLEVIKLKVEVDDGRVLNAKSSGNRLRNYEKAFISKEANKIPFIIPRVLSTCANSHVFAFLEATSNLGEATIIAARSMVDLEIIESHLRHPYAYWFPKIGGKEFDFPSGKKFREVSAISRKIRELMERIGGKWPSVGYLTSGQKIELLGLDPVVKFFEERIVGMSLQDFMDISSMEELKGDISLLNSVPFWRSGLEEYLTSGFPFSRSIDLGKIRDYGIGVEYDGKKVEVGPLAQALTFDPLIKKLHYKYGASPVLRELSRIRVAGKLLSELKEFENVADQYEIRGSGSGVVESIRGTLIHRVRIDNGFITDYSIIQPTTFNATPGGALEEAVKGIPISDLKDPWELSLAVSSLDSCFVTEVEVQSKGIVVTKKRIGGFC